MSNLLVIKETSLRYSYKFKEKYLIEIIKEHCFMAAVLLKKVIKRL